MTICWCKNATLFPFGPNYGVCRSCGTLVSTNPLTQEQLVVKNDETDFYGKQYWLGHQQKDLGFPDIHARSRSDLTERNLHWLKTLLKYCLPTKKDVLELGCAHGSFVALLEQAGYTAAGVEMSPWVVAFGRATFNIPIHIGPIESLGLPEASLDAILMMDVLEHLPDPLGTINFCFKLLKPEGVLLIQTPEFNKEMQYQALVETGSIFLDQLKADEHLYLFSKDSVSKLFRQLGAAHIHFEPAIFSYYDMCFVVSRTPLKTHNPEEIDQALLATPQGRIVLALLDLRKREEDFSRQLNASEKDRRERAEQIETLSSMLKESEADRLCRAEQIEVLSSMLKESKTDCDDRSRQLDILSSRLRDSETDRFNRAEQIETLSRLLKESNADRHDHMQQIEALTSMLKESEVDRLDRAEQIETLSRLLKESNADRHDHMQQIEALTSMLKESEVDRLARAEQTETLSQLLKESNADRHDHMQQIKALTSMLKESEVDRLDRAEQIETLSQLLKESNADRHDHMQQIEALTSMLKELEADRLDRAEQVETLSQLLKESGADCRNYTQQIETLTSLVKTSESQRQEQSRRIEILLKDLQILFSRPLMRGLNRVVSWPEFNSLMQLPKNHE